MLLCVRMRRRSLFVSTRGVDVYVCLGRIWLRPKIRCNDVLKVILLVYVTELSFISFELGFFN